MGFRYVILLIRMVWSGMSLANGITIKTNTSITCHQIQLHCSVLLYSVWIYFCSLHFI